LKNTRRESPDGPKRSGSEGGRERDECHDRREEGGEGRKKNSMRGQNTCRERRMDLARERERHILIQACPTFIKV